jgi:hypothetical protein
MGKYCTIHMWKALRDVPRKTHSCNRCQRCFYEVLIQGCEYVQYANEIFLYLISNTFVNISKNMFLLCHYGVLCVDG